MRMIPKILLFVILLSLQFAIGCSSGPAGPVKTAANSPYEAPKVVGEIMSPDITESSGIAASGCQNGVYWTHNDSGDDAFIFAIDLAGNHLGAWKVTGAENMDWEDIASRKQDGKCFLYIGEIGDNKLKRPEHRIYRIEEPRVGPEAKASSRQQPLPTATAEILDFSYSGKNADAETLLVHPVTGDIYVFTKQEEGASLVYLIKHEFGTSAIQKAELVGKLSVPAIPNGFLTGGEFSSDGRRFVICDYAQAYEYELAQGRDMKGTLDQTPAVVALGKRKNGEAVTYSADGLSIIATSEGKKAPVIEVKRKP